MTFRATIDAFVRGEEPQKFDTMGVYVTAKLLVAWWGRRAGSAPAQRHDRQRPSPPGSAPGTSFSRNVGWGMRLIMLPMMKVIGPLMGMAGSVAKGAKRYVDAADFGADINGRFYASPGKKLVGPLTVQNHAHFLDETRQEMGWNAIVKAAGDVDVAESRAA